MAQLASVVAMTHNPRIYWNAPAASDDDRAAVQAAFAAVRDVVQASRPDVVIAVGNDHLNQFSFDLMPPFAVGVSDAVDGPFWYEDEIMALPRFAAPNHRELAEHLLLGATELGVGVARCERFHVDHAFTVPLSVTMPDGVPVVPLFTNTFGPPLPTNHTFFRLGQAVLDVIRARPATERIAVIGSFNLSVDVGGPCMGLRDEAFDHAVLQMIEAADVEHLVNDLPPARLVERGNSTAEFLNFQAVLGVVGERRPDLCWYRLVEGWGGCPVVAWSGLDSATDSSPSPPASDRSQPANGARERKYPMGSRTASGIVGRGRRAAAAVALLVLAACGDDDDGSADTTSAPALPANTTPASPATSASDSSAPSTRDSTAEAMADTTAPAPFDEILELRLAVATSDVNPVTESVIQLAGPLGYYERNGVRVELVTLDGTPEAVAALNAGDVDLADVSIDAALRLQAEDLLDVRGVVSPTLGPPFLIAAKDDIATVDDLAGRSYAIADSGSLDHTLTQAALQVLGVDPNAPQYVPIGAPASRVQALAAGQVDATTVSYGTFLSIADQPGIHVIVPPDTFFEAVPVQSKFIVALPQVLEDKSDAVQRFVNSVMDISRDFDTDSAPWVAAMAEARTDLAVDDLVATTTFLDGRWCVNGCLNETSLTETLAFIYETEDFEGVPTIGLDQVIDDSFVLAGIEQLGPYSGGGIDER